MENLFLVIPNLYADHHVMKVRQVLFGLNGVQDVYASSAFKEVAVKFEPDKTTREQIIAALAQAGYPEGEPEVVERTPDHTSDPAWDVLAPRQVTTNPVDLQMSGEFRKY